MNFTERSFEKQWAIFFALLYLLLSFIWHFSTDYPWDDDCMTRYFNARNAIHDPIHFVSVWNRPLFTILFFLPFQISKHFVLLMAVLSVTSAYGLFLYLNEKGVRYAYLVIPFLTFQAFYFTISRSSLAEPLAAAIFSFALLFYHRKQFLYFALIGGLIPLARLELAPLLAIWAYILYKNNHLKYILLLGVPTLLWNFAGALIEDGDPMWLWKYTFGKEETGNRYGHTSFGHYFQRYIYVIGPVVFYYFIIGLVESILKRKTDLFVFGQLALAFFIYVIFSWKLNMGQAGGFLRNLIPISPFAAVIAVSGFNYWMKGIEAFGSKLILKNKGGE